MGNINVSEEKLGSGSYASVFKGTMSHNGKRREVAVKKFPNDGEHYAASAKKEYQVLRRLKTHKNIIQLLHMKSDKSYIYLIMEYAELGDLDKYVEKNMPDLKHKIQIMLEMSTGIRYMHSLQPPVIHRDIKPGNILMQSSPQGPVAKICDFGLARIFNPEAISLYMSTDAGTPMYRAPEQFTKGRQQYTSAVDVFSLGLVYMGLLNVSENKPIIECIPESLYGTDMLPYAQHLKEALRHNTLMPALFTLNSSDKWPVTELKGFITQMAAFEAADRINIGDVENTLQTMMSAYGSSTSSVGAQSANPVNRKGEEIAQLSTLLTDVLQDKEEMTQRHEQEKQRHELDRQRHEQEKQRYEQRIREMEEQMTNQERPSTSKTTSSTSKRSPQQYKGVRKQGAEKNKKPAKATQLPSSSGESQLSSFRNNVPSLHRLCGQSPSLVNNFKLRKKCRRLCYYDNSIYCCCFSDACIDVYLVEGGYRKTIALGNIRRPHALHPLSAGRLVLATGSGLYEMGRDGGDITCVKQGNYYDVHINRGIMVTLKKYDSAHDSVESDSVCVLSSTAPYTQTSAFTLGHTVAYTVLLHQNTVYVGDDNTHQVTGYSLTGQRLSQWGVEGRGGPGKLFMAGLCATDNSGRVLVADQGNNRLQLVTSGGEWVVVPGMEGMNPSDVILLTDRMWVLHGKMGNTQISVYKL